MTKQPNQQVLMDVQPLNTVLKALTDAQHAGVFVSRPLSAQYEILESLLRVMQLLHDSTHTAGESEEIGRSGEPPLRRDEEG